MRLKFSRVFFRVSADGEDYGQITMELFDEVVPRTARNFYSIASGQNQQGFTYQNSIFHRVIPAFMLQVIFSTHFKENSSISSSSRVEILRTLMELGVNPYMAESSRMRTFW